MQLRFFIFPDSTGVKPEVLNKKSMVAVKRVIHANS